MRALARGRSYVKVNWLQVAVFRVCHDTSSGISAELFVHLLAVFGALGRRAVGLSVARTLLVSLCGNPAMLPGGVR